MGKVDLNKQQKKEALLNTGFDLFTSKGVNSTSISDIVNQAGVAKGTFYLYFRDKYDLRNFLISHKASQIFKKAESALLKTSITKIDEKIIFIVNNIIDQLASDKTLLTFISKNLSWGFFKNALIDSKYEDDINFMDVYKKMLNESEYKFKDPEVMMFMIIELVSSTCYSAILYNEPVNLEALKPYLFNAIRHIIDDHKI